VDLFQRIRRKRQRFFLFWREMSKIEIDEGDKRMDISFLKTNDVGRLFSLTSTPTQGKKGLRALPQGAGVPAGTGGTAGRA
jgi:hypothetical protein